VHDCAGSISAICCPSAAQILHLRHADRVTAVDAVAEVLELNRAWTSGAADYLLADVFE
jgi:hypothetical protein